MDLRLFFFLFVVCGLSTSLVAQAGRRLPDATHRSDWHLGISDVHTTTLIFPHDVVSVDRGTADVLTQTLNEVTNVLKVKSASELMQPSSLTVITSGGMVYTFRVSYDRNPSTLTYQLAPLRSASGMVPPAYSPSSPAIIPMSYDAAQPLPQNHSALAPGLHSTNAVYYREATADPALPELGTPIDLRSNLDTFINPMGVSYGRGVLNTQSLWTVSNQIHDVQIGSPVAIDRGAGSELRLNDIWIVDDILYYRFSLACQSNITYDIDFWRFYVIDAKQSKRTAVQERGVDLLQVYTDGDQPSHVNRHQNRTFVVAVNKFTIPNKKRLVLEVFERDGGRHHRLKIKNKDIVKARLVSVTPTKQVK